MALSDLALGQSPLLDCMRSAQLGRGNVSVDTVDLTNGATQRLLCQAAIEYATLQTTNTNPILGGALLNAWLYSALVAFCGAPSFFAFAFFKSLTYCCAKVSRLLLTKRRTMPVIIAPQSMGRYFRNPAGPSDAPPLSFSINISIFSDSQLAVGGPMPGTMSPMFWMSVGLMRCEKMPTKSAD